jgi:hypothetical protein
MLPLFPSLLPSMVALLRSLPSPAKQHCSLVLSLSLLLQLHPSQQPSV